MVYINIQELIGMMYSNATAAAPKLGGKDN